MYKLQDYLDSLEEEKQQNNKRATLFDGESNLPQSHLDILALFLEQSHLIDRTKVALMESPEDTYGVVYEAYEEKSLDLEARLQAMLKELNG